MHPHPTYSVVLPCHNEAPHVGALLRYTEKAFADVGHETIVVADGCTDDTAGVVRAFAATHPSVRLIVVPERTGKGAAIRRGILDARGDAVGFMDGDGEIDPALLRKAFDTLREKSLPIVVGNRYAPGAGYHTTPYRHLMSRVYQAMIWILFGLRLHDSQAGLKAFSAEAGSKLFRASNVDGYAFDIDILSHAYWMGYPILEMPMTQRFKGTSTITFRHTLEMVADTFGTFDRHVRDMLARRHAHEGARWGSLAYSLFFYPFTTIAETILRMVLALGKR